MGGSDQWGNIVSGIDLTRRVQHKEVFGLTSPLITTSSGFKMGKTAHGAVWLNEQNLNVWNFWQFWRNTEDKDVERFLKLFTELRQALYNLPFRMGKTNWRKFLPEHKPRFVTKL